ncbi:MAG: phosphatase PAP2 family protein [Rhizorhabdus sp.]
MGAFGFRYDPWGIALFGTIGLLLAAAVAGLIRRQLYDAALLLECYLLLLASALLLSVVTCALAATNAPYADDVLIAIDRYLFGSHWLDIATFFSRRPLTTAILSFVYSSLAWQPFVILGLLVLRGRPRDARAITLAWLIAATLCVLACRLRLRRAAICIMGPSRRTSRTCSSLRHGISSH